jgi:DNA topoisomerase IB
VTVALDEDQRGADRCLVHHCVPGLRRTGGAGKFAYLDAHGCQVRDAATLERIRGLAIPPAWTSVWIAPDPNAHLQATGIDSRGRKQYRYHRAWREDRDHIKFEDMLAFARAQPRLRRRVESALEDANDPLGHRRMLALALRLLGVGLLRVGSDRYARENHHYGLTTLCQHEVIVGPDDSPASPGFPRSPRRQSHGRWATLRRSHAAPTSTPGWSIGTPQDARCPCPGSRPIPGSRQVE